MTENHPEVQAMVLIALEEAREMSTAPDSLYTEVLLQRVEEVHWNISNKGNLGKLDNVLCIVWLECI